MPERNERSETKTIGPSAGVVSALGGGSLCDMLWVPLVLAGAVLLAVVNKTPDAVLAALLFLLAGAGITLLFFGKHERRAFLLTYGVCVLAAGLAQWYSLAVFGVVQSLIDTWTYFNLIAPSPPFPSRADIPLVNAPLAVLIWQWVYAQAWRLGFDFAPYTGALFNGLIVALTAGVTVRTARELFGADRRRLRRVGTLFAWCGMFWLFGALFIRDGFALLLNSLVLWLLVRWLSRPSARRFVVAAIGVGLCSYCMWGIRDKSVALFGLFCLLAFFCWYWRARRSLAHVFATALIPIVLLVGYAYLEEYLSASLRYRAETAGEYVGIAEESSREDSLGMRLIIRQPLPIRLVTGSGALMVFPIPLWAYFVKGSGEYHLIKGLHGIYQVLIFPLFFVGVIGALREAFRSRKELTPAFFLAVYCVMNLLAVAATTMETRHLGQFLPAFLIVCAFPDTREPGERRSVRRAALVWFSLVILAHLAWALARLG